jgi:hypothetical protein
LNKHGACATEAYAQHAETDWKARCCDVKRIIFPNNFKTRKIFVRFEVITAVTKKKAVFWGEAPL